MSITKTLLCIEAGAIVGAIIVGWIEGSLQEVPATILDYSIALLIVWIFIGRKP